MTDLVKAPTRWKAVIVIVVAAFLLYVPYLSYVPTYLAPDEVFFALTAHSIASTARDLNGRFLPLYFQWPPHIFPTVWFQPILVYFMALFFKILPVSESVIRLPTVLIGLTDIVLIYFIAERVFKRERSAIIAAALLTLTPAHLIHSRLAMDFLYPLPFILAWLLCLLMFVERQRLWVLFAATSFLGIGFYSYIASVVMMPIYFVVTCLILLRTHERPLRPLGVAAIGFFWPLVFVVPWLLSHSLAVAQTARRYELYDAARPTSLLDVTSLQFWASISDRISLYWRYFDPAYLFIAGCGYAVATTHRAGIFLLPLMVCVAVGINQIVNFRRTWPNLVLLFGFLSAPLAACVVGQPCAIQRELELLPFAILIATLGLEHLVSARHRLTRLAGWFALVLVPAQFSLFYVDYFTKYRARSAFAFEGNIRGALEEIIDRERTTDSPVYLSTDIRFVDLYWKLYLIKHGRGDLLRSTVYFDPRRLDVQSVPRRSLMLVRVADEAPEAPVGEFRRVRLISNVDETMCCEILERLDVGQRGG